MGNQVSKEIIPQTRKSEIIPDDKKFTVNKVDSERREEMKDEATIGAYFIERHLSMLTI
jgi:hypothetical protein